MWSSDWKFFPEVTKGSSRQFLELPLVTSGVFQKLPETVIVSGHSQIYPLSVTAFLKKLEVMQNYLHQCCQIVNKAKFNIISSIYIKQHLIILIPILLPLAALSHQNHEKKIFLTVFPTFAIVICKLKYVYHSQLSCILSLVKFQKLYIEPGQMATLDQPHGSIRLPEQGLSKRAYLSILLGLLRDHCKGALEQHRKVPQKITSSWCTLGSLHLLLAQGGVLVCISQASTRMMSFLLSVFQKHTHNFCFKKLSGHMYQTLVST